MIRLTRSRSTRSKTRATVMRDAVNKVLILWFVSRRWAAFYCELPSTFN